MIPKFQDPTPPPSHQNPFDRYLLKCQMTHENMDAKVIRKTENIPYQGVGLQFQLILHLLIEQ